MSMKLTRSDPSMIFSTVFGLVTYNLMRTFFYVICVFLISGIERFALDVFRRNIAFENDSLVRIFLRL